MFFKSDGGSNAELNEFAREKQFSNCTTNIRSDYTLESGIAHFAKEKNADLIALGTQGP